jgi:nucleotide-binding universal stress UspA family protein
MKKILYTTDFSENSINALKFAFTFSLKMKAKLYIGHILDVPVFVANTAEIPIGMTTKIDYVEFGEKRLKKFCKTHLGESVDLSKCVFKSHDALNQVDGILELSDSIGANFLVVGTRGESVLQEILMGSTAKGLVKKAKCPVIAVPSKEDLIHPTSLVYTTDFEGVDDQVVVELVPIAKLYGASLTVLHFSQTEEPKAQKKMDALEKRVAKRVKYVKLEFIVLQVHSVFEAMNDYVATDKQAFLVLLEREKKGILKQLFHRDLVRRMVSQTPIPLLSFHQKYLLRQKRLFKKQELAAILQHKGEEKRVEI